MTRWRKCRSTLKMRRPSQLIPVGKANDNTWWKSVTLSMPGPRSCFLLRPTMPFGRRRTRIAILAFLRIYGRPRMFTFDHDTWFRSAVVAGGISLPRWCAFSSAWALPPTSVQRIGQTKMPTLRDIIAHTSKNVCWCTIPVRWRKCAA